jgi:hypothetical protein
MQCHVVYVLANAFEISSASEKFMKRIHTNTKEHDDVTGMYLVCTSITAIMRKTFEQRNFVHCPLLYEHQTVLKACLV